MKKKNHGSGKRGGFIQKAVKSVGSRKGEKSRQIYIFIEGETKKYGKI